MDLPLCPSGQCVLLQSSLIQLNSKRRELYQSVRNESTVSRPRMGNKKVGICGVMEGTSGADPTRTKIK